MLTILSLGAGVQSTTLALMAAHGDVTPMPDCAIFADTQSEPAAVYEHLAWLMSPNVLPFPVHVVSKGSLRQEILDACAGLTGAWGRPPFFVKNADNAQAQLLWELLPLAGGTELDKGRRRKRDSGMTNRQCTQDYKLDVIRAKTRQLAGLKPRSRGPEAPIVEQWVGISWDERVRAKPAEERWIKTRWPLLERQITRIDCMRWLADHGYTVPPKSACTFCPFHSDEEWRRLRDHDPTSWADAVAIDRALRDDAKHFSLKGTLYLHRSLKPLDQVDLSTPEDRGQGALFPNAMAAYECRGMCGI
ncbi:MAG TPA: hypothetical protein VHW66_19195 [Stellaceae bacterium]|jgi:hypothetical protein|nr:hypothetical protein [Stellaceae bacterium]